MSPEDRKEFLDTVYEILVSTNAKTLSDLNSDKLALVKAWNTLDDDSKVLIRKCIKTLLATVKKDKEKDNASEDETTAQPEDEPEAEIPSEPEAKELQAEESEVSEGVEQENVDNIDASTISQKIRQRLSSITKSKK